MLKILILWLAFVSSAFGASAYVSTTGNDANNCLTIATACKTPERGAQVAGNRGYVFISPGSYYGVALQVMHSDFIQFMGDCSNPSAVTLYGNPGQNTVWAQDHATIILKCLKLGTTGNASTALAARQFSIVDWENVVFGHFPLGKHISLNEMSKGNCLGTMYVTGDAATHAQVFGMSSMALQCNVVFSNTPNIDYYLSVSENSFVLSNLTTFSGSVNVTTHSYALDASVLKIGAVSIPGPAGTNSNGVVQ